MIVIVDINANTEILNVAAKGHTPWTMWGRLAEDGAAYSMNYRDTDPELVGDADLLVFRVEETTWSDDACRDGLETCASEANCPKLIIIEGDMNGFRNWRNDMHIYLSELCYRFDIIQVSRDPRIVEYYKRLYPHTFFFASLFDINYLKRTMGVDPSQKEKLIFMPYASGIRGDRNGMLSAILAQNLAEKHNCRVVMLQSQTDDALFAFKMGMNNIIALPYIDENDRNSIIAQSSLCVNLDTIPGFGKVAAEMACARTFHLGCGTCGVTHYLWGHVSHSYLEYDKLFELGDAVLSNPNDFKDEIGLAYNKADDLDVIVGRQKLKKELGVDKL